MIKRFWDMLIGASIVVLFVIIGGFIHAEHCACKSK